ncbi:hypothetical protein ACIQGZ_02390 [Streptomyces sp. NPDC092296]|uniref:hypothetical protein n=1 Tax=Streptomyces sp. NPDC092296 TaxID=3366012 RepID=UPI0038062482
MTPRPPLAATPAWRAVMHTAGHRCQCTGQCGDPHTRGGGRCDREHDGHSHRRGGGTVRLLAAPADPAQLGLPAHRAAALPAGELAAWCPTCHDHTRKTAARAAEAADTSADALF